jgi:hypothetical protein
MKINCPVCASKFVSDEAKQALDELKMDLIAEREINSHITGMVPHDGSNEGDVAVMVMDKYGDWVPIHEAVIDEQEPIS